MDVYETITSLVETYKIIPSTLKLEITETAIMTGTAGELEMIERFRKSGFQVEIDDFGSGYSSFNTLKDMDVDVLKIDMGFLRTTRPERLEKYVHYKYDHITHQNTWSFRYHGGR